MTRRPAVGRGARRGRTPARGGRDGRSCPTARSWQRAAAALAVEAGADAARRRRPGDAGSRVVLLVGAGDNGGDALLRRCAPRRPRCTGRRRSSWPTATTRPRRGALRRAGGRVHRTRRPASPAAELVAQADLVLDGILGIGGRGALRGPPRPARGRRTRGRRRRCSRSTCRPASTPTPGPSPTPTPWSRADRTAVFGVLKPGLLVGAGAGVRRRPRRGRHRARSRRARPTTTASCSSTTGSRPHALPRPRVDDDKYTRGVVGLATRVRRATPAPGCSRRAAPGRASPGSCATPARRRARSWRPSPTWWPPPAASATPVARSAGWSGPAAAPTRTARRTVLDAVATRRPARPRRRRADDPRRATLRCAPPSAHAAAVTLLTPHAGRARPHHRRRGRCRPGRRPRAALARDLGVVVLLKGVVDRRRRARRARRTSPSRHRPSWPPPDPATCSRGFAGSLLAHHEARHALDADDVARLAAVAAHVHGRRRGGRRRRRSTPSPRSTCARAAARRCAASAAGCRTTREPPVRGCRGRDVRETGPVSVVGDAVAATAQAAGLDPARPGARCGRHRRPRRPASQPARRPRAGRAPR